jgi:hypothetical protein
MSGSKPTRPDNANKERPNEYRNDLIDSAGADSPRSLAHMGLQQRLGLWSQRRCRLGGAGSFDFGFDGQNIERALSMGFDQKGDIVFRVVRQEKHKWDVVEADFDKPLASFDSEHDAYQYASGLANAKPGARVTVERQSK